MGSGGRAVFPVRTPAGYKDKRPVISYNCGQLKKGNYIPVYTVYLETDSYRNESLANV